MKRLRVLNLLPVKVVLASWSLGTADVSVPSAFPLLRNPLANFS